MLSQLLGTNLNVLLLPVLPGPTIGLVLLPGYFLARGEVDKPVSEAAGSLLRYLLLLLVSAAIGMMAYARKIAADFQAIVGALVPSLVLLFLFVDWVMQKLVDCQQRRQEKS